MAIGITISDYSVSMPSYQLLHASASLYKALDLSLRRTRRISKCNLPGDLL